MAGAVRFYDMGTSPIRNWHAGRGVGLLASCAAALAMTAGCSSSVPVARTTTVVVVQPKTASTSVFSSPTSAPTTSPAGAGGGALPSVTVTGPSTEGPYGALQAFANDVAAGNIETIVRRCWTFSPTWLREVYGERTHRQQFLAAMGRPGLGAQITPYWQADGYQVDVTPNEQTSPYACPVLSGPGVPSVLAPVQAEYVAMRLDRRLHGRPIQPADTSHHYLLLCDLPGDADGPNGTPEDQVAPDVVAAIHEVATGPVDATVSADSTTLTAVQGSHASLTVSLAGLNGSPCVSAIRTG